jgi:hypothetical protein
LYYITSFAGNGLERRGIFLIRVALAYLDDGAVGIADPDRTPAGYEVAEVKRSQGNLGIMDYYRMKNVQADTGMRDAIGATGGEPEPTRRHET